MSAVASSPEVPKAAQAAAHGRQNPHSTMPDFACLRCESKGMKCDFTKFKIEGDLDPMCVRCVRAGAKYCIKQRLPQPGGDEWRMIYIDPRVGDDYDREEVFAMIDDYLSGPKTYTFDGTPCRAKDVNGWAFPAWPQADRFAQLEKPEKKEGEPAAPTKEGSAAAKPSAEQQRQQREKRRKKLTQRERAADDWVESADQSWGKVLPARINKSKTQIPALKTTVAVQKAQHDLEWDALCDSLEAQGLTPPSPEEKPELETAETAILRANLRNYPARRTHLTQNLKVMRSVAKDK
ncbi:hypothetical protein PG993_000732 [Apiospora rasikravindrae]|uniref:Zn(2)-C6 fungal-type domain-containing protein n=1 Tax=Apiospora rasikravindrae TaxID=990691 RepID=A0ABR1UBP4_9PEZI